MHSSLLETVCLCSVLALIGLLSVSSGGGRQQETLIGTPLPPATLIHQLVSNCHKQPLLHITHYLLCISATFHINGALKSTLGHCFTTGWTHHMLLWALVISNLSFTSLPWISQEAYIADLDAKSGASLKLTLLNPRGRIWTMVAGGGASVVYR